MKETKLPRHEVFFPRIHRSASHEFHSLADWLLLYTWFGLSLPEGLGDSLRHCRRSDLGRSGPPEARAANMLLFGSTRGLANLPNDGQHLSDRRSNDRGAREDQRATTAISVEEVMNAVLAQLDALDVSAR